MKIFLLFIICTYAGSCNNNNKTTGNREPSKSDTGKPSIPNQETATRFHLLSFDIKNSTLKDSIKGNIINTAAWADAEAEQYVLFSETVNETKSDGTQNKSLFAYCFTKEADGWKRKWFVQDRIEKCEVDATCEFYPASLSITDVDMNDIAEVTFIYKLSCKGDVSPDDKKLIMYAGTNKYAIRGTTGLQMADSKEGGTKNVDAAFKKAPKALLDYAEQQWEKFGNEKY